MQNLKFEEFCSVDNFKNIIDSKSFDLTDIDQFSKIENGTILVSNDKDGLYIKAKEGIIRVLEIQGENAKRMNINDFLRGNKLQITQIFN